MLTLVDRSGVLCWRRWTDTSHQLNMHLVVTHADRAEEGYWLVHQTLGNNETPTHLSTLHDENLDVHEKQLNKQAITVRI